MADSSSKIRAPSAKIYDIPARDVWSLLGVNRRAKNEIDRSEFEGGLSENPVPELTNLVT